MTAPDATDARIPTPVDGIAEQWVETLVDLDPTVATWIGMPGRLGEYADLSPDGHARAIEETRRVVARLEGVDVVDDVDRVTKTDLLAESRLAVEAADAGLWMRDLNVIDSPAQHLRDVFDLMPTATVEDWEHVSGRLSALPAAMAGYIETLRSGIRQGTTPARRQVREVLAQARRTAASDGFFPDLVGSAGLAAGEDLPASLAADLGRGAESARAAYDTLAAFLDEELSDAATETDAVGRDLYALQSRRFLGASVDLDETYEWGLEELARMTAEQESVAREVAPGASVLEAIAVLDADPARRLVGTDALQAWMQRLSDAAIEQLSSHFDVPAPLRTLECRIAPTQEGGIYYTGPSDDFSRPGRMWWSVPAGETEFATWRETTTVYHEGIPGHHLQVGQAVVNRASLNTWRRQLAGTSGHAEGWALYAERLMQELGHLDDPGDRLGMLDGQRMRAARVVLDLGVHLGKPRPDGPGAWDFEYAVEFMTRNVSMSDAVVRFEVNRYFGWPGQAPAYKVGQRIWEDVRDACREREGDRFDIRDFHRRALDLGGVGLDTLRSTMLR
jgi:uncharacterized protein (DUF885 family)